MHIEIGVQKEGGCEVKRGREVQGGGEMEDGEREGPSGEVRVEKDKEKEEGLEEIYFIKDKNMIIRQTSSANKAKLYNLGNLEKVNI